MILWQGVISASQVASEFGFTPASRSRIFSFTQKNAMLLDAVAEPEDGLASW
jgi:phage terminase small subunit